MHYSGGGVSGVACVLEVLIGAVASIIRSYVSYFQYGAQSEPLASSPLRRHGRRWGRIQEVRKQDNNRDEVGNKVGLRSNKHAE